MKNKAWWNSDFASKFFVLLSDFTPVHLYLIFEKLSWENQVQQIGFLACINQLQNWFLQATQAVKIQVTWFFLIDFLEIKYRSAGGLMAM